MGVYLARVASVVLVVTAACGNITRKQDDGGVRDDATISDGPTDDSMMITHDAAVDALVLPPTEAREIVPGGIRMQSATYTFDVQLGHGTSQNKATSTTYTVEGNTGVKP